MLAWIILSVLVITILLVMYTQSEWNRGSGVDRGARRIDLARSGVLATIKLKQV